MDIRVKITGCQNWLRLPHYSGIVQGAEYDLRLFDAPQNPLRLICPALRAAHLAVGEADKTRKRISDRRNPG
jgi:hypothetical protein